MRLDPEEIAAWKLSDQHIEDAIRELRVTGYVIFESVLDAPRVRELHSAFMEIFERYVAEIGDNRGKQRQGGVPLPIEGTFAAPDVIGNPHGHRPARTAARPRSGVQLLRVRYPDAGIGVPACPP